MTNKSLLRFRRTNNQGRHAIIWLAALFVLGSFSGCYQRKMTPEISYRQSDVDLIRREIEKFEWD